MVRKLAPILAAILLAVTAAAAATATTVDKRITGGEDAKVGEIPFIVSIQRLSRHVCGGTLLDSTTVLSAAHCFEKESDNLTIRAGTLDARTGGVVVNVTAVKIHPNWGTLWSGPSFAENDISIIKLSTPIEASHTIRFTSLPPNSSTPEPGSSMVVAGWGHQSVLPPNANLSSLRPAAKLSKVPIYIHPLEECKKLWHFLENRETVFCAGGDGKGSCALDSGGPVFDPVTGYVVGIVSFGMNDKDETNCNQVPGIYTDVGSYIPFIEKYLGAAGYCAINEPDAHSTAPPETFDQCVEKCVKEQHLKPQQCGAGCVKKFSKRLSR
ncbi:Peptidase cysteine/serine, trypsin-like protein [Metarhizium guizhouense ARSEF 977]|uniref:Peptidase cysteine/serine, trypsin-like protein n=1 Tax=Metarhizium guizhouense (strain ARSEF 977) TaxID=1276136 RepID=A0A0B4GQW5_METGA|nr:Peptidase cysteine/serine, trypsin-like protein [Metarhizium guizhouense ARSEF 977]